MYILYNQSTGRIINKVKCSQASIELDITDTIKYIVCNDNTSIKNKYLVDGALVSFTPFDISCSNTDVVLQADTTLITNVPINTTLYVDGVFQGICIDDTIELKFDEVGIYRIRLECFTYLVKELIYYVI